MRAWLALAALLAGVGGAAAAPDAGGPQGFELTACKPPLRYAAGACVRRCPAGFRDTGRVCRFRNMRR